MHMKKFTKTICAILALALMTGLLTACPNDTKSSSQKDDRTDLTTRQTETGLRPDMSEPNQTINTMAPDQTTGTSDEGETSEPEETTTSDGTTATGTTAKPTAKPLGKVKVTDAYKKTLKNEKVGKFTVRIPKLTIEGVDTSKINKEMYNLCKKEIGKHMGSNYSYYIGKKYVSILLSFKEQHDDSPATYYSIFNISRSTGKKLTKKAMLKTLGISNKKYTARVKKAVKRYYVKGFNYSSKKADKWMKGLYKKATSAKTLKRAVPYVNSKGKVCYMITQLPVPGGAEAYDTCGTC